MKIAVLVKQVPGTESSLSIRDEKNWIDESTTTFVMNPPDNFALEEALMIKEKLNKPVIIISIERKIKQWRSCCCFYGAIKITKSDS